MCANHPQQLFLPQPALLTRQKAHWAPFPAQIPAAEDKTGAYPAVGLSGVGLELEKHPHAHTHPTTPTFSGSAPASPHRVSCSVLSGFCCWGTSRCPGSGWDDPQTHWPGAGGAAGAGCPCLAPGGHGGFVCLCAVWEAPPAWHQKVSAFKKVIVFTLCFWKRKGEMGRGMRAALASSASSSCCCGHPPSCVPGSTTSSFPNPTELGQSPHSLASPPVSFPILLLAGEVSDVKHHQQQSRNTEKCFPKAETSPALALHGRLSFCCGKPATQLKLIVLVTAELDLKICCEMPQQPQG